MLRIHNFLDFSSRYLLNINQMYMGFTVLTSSFNQYFTKYHRFGRHVQKYKRRPIISYYKEKVNFPIVDRSYIFPQNYFMHVHCIIDRFTLFGARCSLYFTASIYTLGFTYRQYNSCRTYLMVQLESKFSGASNTRPVLMCNNLLENCIK